MGVLYSALPLNEEARGWLAAEGIPHSNADGRHPTPAEIRDVVSCLNGYTVEFHGPTPSGSWQADVSGAANPETEPWTEIVVSDYRGEHEPSEFYFSKGWPSLVVTILHALAQNCGPFLLLADGESPIVVDGVTDAAHLINTWEESRSI